MFLKEVPGFKRATVIDVRSEEEFLLMHPNGAVNVPLGLLHYYLDEIKDLPRPWALCCEEGVRSGTAEFLLKMLGFEEVYNCGAWLDVDNELRETSMDTTI